MLQRGRKGREVVEEGVVEGAQAGEVGQVLLGEPQILDLVEELLQARP